MMSPAQELQRHALQQAIRFYAATTSSPDDAGREMWRVNCERAAISSAMAFLLDALIEHAPQVADTIAAELDEMLSDGEPMTDWVTEELGPVECERVISEVQGAAR